MLDMFPFLRMNGNTADEKVSEIENYLIQFKEILEFALGNITEENLSPELIKKLNGAGANITNKEEELSQISAKSLTIADVCNSQSFKDAILKESIKNVSFNINFENGHLEYRGE